MKKGIFFIFLSSSILLSAQAQTRKIESVDADSFPQIQLNKGTDPYHYFTLPDTNIRKYTLPTDFIKPGNWIKKENALQEREFYGSSYPSTYSLDEALAAIDTAKNFWQICAAKSWCLRNSEKVFPHLVARLGVKQKIGLTNAADLIIWDRMNTGDLTFYGHGGTIKHDLFTVAGRASWILHEITGEEFSAVHGAMTEEQAVEFKKLWVNYIEKLKK